MELTIKKTGIIKGGYSYSWKFGSPVRVFKGDSLISEIEINGFNFVVSNSAQLAGIADEIDSICMECATAQDEATIAFEWQAYSCIEGNLKRMLRKFEFATFRNADNGNATRYDVILTTLLDFFIDAACAGVQSMMSSVADSDFSDYKHSEVIREKATQILHKYYKTA